MKKSSKIVLILGLITTLAIAGYILGNRFFADTTPDQGVEKLVDGNFETASSFITDPAVANHWDVVTNSGQATPAIVTSDFGRTLEVGIDKPTSYSYNQISFPVSLVKNKLYQIEITFGSEFGSGQFHGSTGFGNSASTPPGALLFNYDMTTVQDNDPTLFKAYYSPLIDRPEGFFYIKIDSSDAIHSGKLKIKSASVLEKNGSELASYFPDKVITYPDSNDPAYYKAIPWNLGETSFPIRLMADPGTPATSDEKAIVYQHDTDDLNYNYHPMQDEVTNSLYVDSAKGETKDFYFTVFANQELTDLTVSIDDPFGSGTVIPPVVPPPVIPPVVPPAGPPTTDTGSTGTTTPATNHPASATPSGNLLPQVGTNPPKVYALRYREKQPVDKNWGIFSYKNELVEPFYKRKTLAAGQNQSFMVEIPISKDQEGKNYTANLTISANDFSKLIPVNLKVRNFTLSDLTASRVLYLFNQRWVSDWNADQETTKKQIAAEIDSGLAAGFNAFEFGPKLGDLLKNEVNSPNKVTGYELLPMIKYAITYAAQQSPTKEKFSGRNLLEMENLIGDILRSNGYLPATGGYNYSIIRKLLLGPVDGDSGDVLTTIELTSVQKTDIQNQLTTVLTSIDSQMTTLSGRSGSWRYYLADEPGGDKIKVSQWTATTAKAAGVADIIIGGNYQKVVDGVGTPLEAFAVYAPGATSTIGQYINNHQSQPWLYSGVYALFDGNEIRNRFYTGFSGVRDGFENILAWYYMGKDKTGSKKATVDQMNDFYRGSNAGWDNGRWWNLEYYDNPVYRDSYTNYYGYPIDPVKDDQYKNITSLQYLGFKQGNDDLKYINTFKSILASKPPNDPTVDQIKTDFYDLLRSLPTNQNTIFGFSRFNGKSAGIMNKVLLDSYRKQIADWTEQLMGM